MKYIFGGMKWIGVGALFVLPGRLGRYTSYVFYGAGTMLEDRFLR